MSNITLPPPNAADNRLDRVSEAYSDPGWWYNLRGLGILTFAYRTTLWSQIGFLERNLSENHLEIPVGTGSLLKLILRYRRFRKRPLGRVVAVDYSPTMVASSRRVLQKWSLVDVQQGDVADLSFPDQSFDSINVANGFHCFPDPEAALRELWRVLKPGCTLATNVLLHPRSPWGILGRPLQWLAQRIDDWGKRKGLLVDTFDLDDIRRRFQTAGFTLLEDRVRGNTVNILAKKTDNAHATA